MRSSSGPLMVSQRHGGVPCLFPRSREHSAKSGLNAEKGPSIVPVFLRVPGTMKSAPVKGLKSFFSVSSLALSRPVDSASSAVLPVDSFLSVHREKTGTRPRRLIKSRNLANVIFDSK